MNSKLLHRDLEIDFLRCVGMLMIILAHISPPTIIFQLRNFDVPLMVLLSGLSFGLTYRPTTDLKTYLWKRVKRLVFPVWIFLTIYFLTMFLYDSTWEYLAMKKVIASYFLLSGIGYVWIIRILLIVAFFAPSLYWVHKKIASNAVYFSMVLLYYLLYEGLNYLVMPYCEKGVGKLFSEVVLYTLPFLAVFAVGLRISDSSRVVTRNLLFTFLFILSTLCMYHYVRYGTFPDLQQYKYPASFYYTIYAMAVSLLLLYYRKVLWGAIETQNFFRIPLLFIAQNSIWIYLWHIPVAMYYYGSSTHFLVKYFAALIGASFIVFIQRFCLEQLLLPRLKNKDTTKTLRILFMG